VASSSGDLLNSHHSQCRDCEASSQAKEQCLALQLPKPYNFRSSNRDVT
jgi:hypothetical protein